MTWLGGLLLAAVSFVLGRIFAQSEAVLAEKRRVYEEFLRSCPSPHDLNRVVSDDEEQIILGDLRRLLGPLLLYASPRVANAASRYLTMLGQIEVDFSVESAAESPKFVALVEAQNDIVLEMRRDALGWSVFGYRGKSRLPSEEMAKLSG